MGVVKKQGVSNSILIMLGAVIGAVNVMVLFPKIISEEYFGLTRVIVELSYIAAQFGLIGGHAAIVKFWSVYVKPIVLVKFISSYVFLATLLTFLLLVLFKVNIQSFYLEKSMLFSSNYNYIFIIFIVGVFFEFLTSISISLLKSYYSILLKDVIMRAYVSLIIIGYYFEFYSQDDFIFLFVLGYVFIAIALAIVLFIYEKQFFVKTSEEVAKTNKLEVFKFSAVNFFTSFSSGIVNRLDLLMIAALISVQNGFENGFQAAAVYTLALYTATILEIPSRGLFSISQPLIAKYWNDDDRASLINIYKKSAINLSIVSVLMFALLWVNIDDLLSFLGDGYQSAKSVILILSISKLFNMALGVNNIIISTSSYYRVGSYIMFSLIFITFSLNYLLIPSYGIVGAAVGSFFSLVFYNLASFLFLYYKYKFQPFTLKTIYVYCFGLISYWLAYYIETDYSLITIAAKGTVVIVCYLPLIYFFKLSEDYNSTIDNLIVKYLKSNNKKSV